MLSCNHCEFVDPKKEVIWHMILRHVELVTLGFSVSCASSRLLARKNYRTTVLAIRNMWNGGQCY